MHLSFTILFCLFLVHGPIEDVHVVVSTSVCVCGKAHMHTARSQGFTWQTFASFLKPFAMHKQGEEKGDSNQISASLFVVPDAPLCSLLLASWCGQLNVERGVCEDDY